MSNFHLTYEGGRLDAWPNEPSWGWGFSTRGEAEAEILRRVEAYGTVRSRYEIVDNQRHAVHVLDATLPAASAHHGPAHYHLTPEPIDVIDGWGLGYNRGQVIKYLSRAGRKAYDGMDTGQSTIRDLEKALSYLKRELNALRGTPGW